MERASFVDRAFEREGEALLRALTELDDAARGRKASYPAALAEWERALDKVLSALASGANPARRAFGRPAATLLESLMTAGREIGETHALTASVEALLDGGVRPDDGRTGGGPTALLLAAEEGLARITALLLRAGADPNAADGLKATPLHRAARRGGGACSALLIRAGADIEARDSLGRTPLAVSRCAETTLALLEAGANPLVEDMLGETPLHRFGTAENARMLLEAGADPRAADSEDNLPMHKAAGRPEVVELLLEAGSPVDEENRNGQTPLSIALLGDDSLPRDERVISAESARILLRAGADPFRSWFGGAKMTIEEACAKCFSTVEARDFDIRAELAEIEAARLEASVRDGGGRERRRI